MTHRIPEEVAYVPDSSSDILNQFKTHFASFIISTSLKYNTDGQYTKN